MRLCYQSLGLVATLVEALEVAETLRNIVHYGGIFLLVTSVNIHHEFGGLVPMPLECDVLRVLGSRILECMLIHKV